MCGAGTVSRSLWSSGGAEPPVAWHAYALQPATPTTGVCASQLSLCWCPNLPTARLALECVLVAAVAVPVARGRRPFLHAQRVAFEPVLVDCPARAESSAYFAPSA